MIHRIARFLQHLRRFHGNHQGVAAVEFALLLPVMIVLYIGGVEVTDGLAIKRKVSHISSALSDLVAQDQSLDASEMSAILDAATAMIMPYSASLLSIRATGVSLDSSGKATVLWSQVRNASCQAVATHLTIPAALAQPSTFLVHVEIGYAYTPMVGSHISGPITVSDSFYQRPRLVSKVTAPTC